MSKTRTSQITLFMLATVLVAGTEAAELKFIWQAEVQSEHVSVYTDISRNNRVVMVLNKGDFLNVVLEVSVSTDRWCRVAVPGEPEPAGYVLCKELRMRRFDSKPATNDAIVPVKNISAENIGPIANGATKSTTNSTALTNKDISDMFRAGLSAEVLTAKIKSSPCNFDTGPAALKYLKTAGIPDTVILAMVEAPHGQPTGMTPAVATQTLSSAPSVPPVSSDGKTRVLVTDSQSWESRGGSSGGGNRNGWGSSSWFAGGARPQTAEIIKTLNERCPQITVTNRLDRADFVLTLDHEGGKAVLQRHNKIAVFNKDGDVIFSKSTISLGNSVKDACQVMSEAQRSR